MTKPLNEIRNQIEQVLKDFPGMIHRGQLAKLLGLSSRTIANKDSAGEGIENPLRIGRQVYYDKQAVCDWLVSRAQQCGSKQ